MSLESLLVVVGTPTISGVVALLVARGGNTTAKQTTATQSATTLVADLIDRVETLEAKVADLETARQSLESERNAAIGFIDGYGMWQHTGRYGTQPQLPATVAKHLNHPELWATQPPKNPRKETP